MHVLGVCLMGKRHAELGHLQSSQLWCQPLSLEGTVCSVSSNAGRARRSLSARTLATRVITSHSEPVLNLLCSAFVSQQAVAITSPVQHDSVQ